MRLGRPQTAGMTLTRKRKLLLATALPLALAAGLASVGVRPTSHPVEAATLGTTSSTSRLEQVLGTPGPVVVETVKAADWEITRAGLLNLDHEKARTAGLEDGPEPIQIFFHALRHPERGLYLVDTGIERALRDAPERAALRVIAAKVMNVDKMRFATDTASWLARQPEPLAGVLLTHLHLDHLSGLPDVPRGTPLYAGPGETRERAFLNVFVQPVIDRTLAGHAPLRELRFQADPSGVFAGVLDLFGDQSLFALLVPGHTAGSTAYLARTPDGPVLLVGDACHTAWGWEHGVEPGTFSRDRAESALSLERLRVFAEKHPEVEVRLGHQVLPAEPRAVGAASR